MEYMSQEGYDELVADTPIFAIEKNNKIFT